jgi:hypothetical protein
MRCLQQEPPAVPAVLWEGLLLVLQAQHL